jgi:predicted regulator of amino acid metabolism with ACT domain
MSGTFSYVAGIDLGKQIAAALGINIDQVHKMTIEMDVEGPAYVIVEAFVPEGNGVVEQISRYRLVE